MRIALVGDVLISRELGSAGLRVLGNVSATLRQAEMVVGNLESVVHEYQYPPGPPSIAGWTHCPPSAVAELREAGLTALSRANNHAGDWGREGWDRTSQELARAGLLHAGVGNSFRDALSARYATTNAGRLALISVTTTSPEHAVAADAGDGILARPGVAYLRTQEWFEVTGESFDGLRELASSFNVSSSDHSVSVGQMRFTRGELARRRSHCDPEQLEEITLVIRQASCTADVVVVAVHSHEHNGALEEPSEALVELARAAVAAGADIVACHGPHVLRRVERTGRAVIAYGLGNFIFQPNDIPRVPLEGRRLAGVSARALPHVACMRTMDWDAEPRFWQSAILMCDIPDRTSAIALQVEPLSILRTGRSYERGLPQPARGTDRDEICAQVDVEESLRHLARADPELTRSP